jgi:hypothetical protein
MEFFQCGYGRNWKLFFQTQLRTDNTPRGPNTYTSSSQEDYLFLVQKSRRMRWAEHVAHVGEDRGVHRVLVRKPEVKGHWGDQDVDGRVILIRIFRKLDGVVGTGWSWLRIGTGGGHLWIR